MWPCSATVGPLSGPTIDARTGRPLCSSSPYLDVARLKPTPHDSRLALDSRRSRRARRRSASRSAPVRPAPWPDLATLQARAYPSAPWESGLIDVPSGLEGGIAFETEIASALLGRCSARYRGVDRGPRRTGAVPRGLGSAGPLPCYLLGLATCAAVAPECPLRRPAGGRPLGARPARTRRGPRSAHRHLRRTGAPRPRARLGDDAFRSSPKPLRAGSASRRCRSWRSTRRDRSGSASGSAGGARPTPSTSRRSSAHWISAAEHGMNASTFAARVIASTGADVAAAISGALGALLGPLHGGAPSRVLQMLDDVERILADPEAYEKQHVDRGRPADGLRPPGLPRGGPASQCAAAHLPRNRSSAPERLPKRSKRPALAELEARKPGSGGLATYVEFWLAENAGLRRSSARALSRRCSPARGLPDGRRTSSSRSAKAASSARRRATWALARVPSRKCRRMPRASQKAALSRRD